VSALEMCADSASRAVKPNIPRTLSLCLLFLFLASTLLWALDPNLRISQYAHTAWRIQDGVFNGSPIVITQTTDGYLWIGTNIGLVRFDGVRFITWNPPAGSRLLDSRIFSLLGTSDGSLWIGTGFSVSRWKNGELTNYPIVTGRIESVVEDDDGAVWIARTQPTDKMGPLCRVKDDQPRCFGVGDGIPFALATQLRKGTAGELWVAGYSELCRWKPGSCTSYFATASRRPETFASLHGIATGPDGSVWAVINRSSKVLQLEEFDHGTWVSRTFPEIHVVNSNVTTLFVDRSNTLWVGTADHGIFRIRGKDVDHFGSADGLSADAVGRVYQDAEGTLWVVTSGGIDNFHDLKVATYSMREGLSAAGASSVLASPSGTVWIGNFRALDLLRDGRLSAIRAPHDLPGLNVTTVFEDHAGRLWLGVDNGLWVYDRGTFSPVRHADGSPLGIIFTITEDVQHDVWVRAGQQHLDHIHDVKLQEELASSQISTSSSYILASNPRGGIVLGLVNGDLVEYDNGKTQTFPSNEEGNRRQIRDLLVESDGSVWGTTLDELARWKDGVRKNLTTRNGLPCDGIFDLVKDDRDSLWLYSQCGLITIEKSELDRWWDHPDSQVKFKLLDAFDGVRPGLTPLKPQATRSPDGRLWFVNGQILQVLDPDHLQENLRPPPVQVEEIVADRTRYSPSENLQLPALTRDLEIRYTALSFVVPQKVRFRYKLQGRDTTWQEPGTRRQAFYSELRPGNYRFQVIACSNDGVWSETGASLNFSVAPAWFQTIWFRLLCAVIVILVVWAVYRFRVRQIARAISTRFDERLAERTRIARDLHDTFLQTIQGSKLVADDALEGSTDPARMRRAMEQLSIWLDRAMQEGRAALNSLRTSTTQTNDLAEAFRRATENGQVPDSMEAALSVVGDAREMHPIVRDEIYRIGYEAIRNAYLHSQATRLEVELRYEQDLTVRVRDNGVGVEPAIASQGKEGHFGLRGMRERAARIGAHLTIATSPASGTDVTLVVPGRIVFRKARTPQSPRGKNHL
jgi:signal transduction histidine kinase/ligand-binding sensor domain-containing protein